jgi:hypothetical protein
VKRREFITLFGGAAAWPLAARAQQPERMRRIGVLLPASGDDADYQSWVGAFHQALAQSGWSARRLDLGTVEPLSRAFWSQNSGRSAKRLACRARGSEKQPPPARAEWRSS